MMPVTVLATTEHPGASRLQAMIHTDLPEGAFTDGRFGKICLRAPSSSSVAAVPGALVFDERPGPADEELGLFELL
jgi:hypothetical protein